MEIIFIRHGEPNYTPCEKRGFIGHGRDLAPLTPLGVTQAEAAAADPILKGSQLILSSPYTRALQTAAIISRLTGISLTVHIDLREWLPDKTYQPRSSTELHTLHEDFCSCKGIYPEGEIRAWEEISEIIQRVKPVLHSYYQKGFGKIIVVAHGGVIRRFIGNYEVNYCTPYSIKYDGQFACFNWV